VNSYSFAHCCCSPLPHSLPLSSSSSSGYKDSVQNLKSANLDLSHTPSKSAIRTPVKSSASKNKTRRTSTPFAHKGKSSPY
jgi:hypothetical protein